MHISNLFFWKDMEIPPKKSSLVFWQTYSLAKLIIYEIRQQTATIENNKKYKKTVKQTLIFKDSEETNRYVVEKNRKSNKNYKNNNMQCLFEC